MAVCCVERACSNMRILIQLYMSTCMSYTSILHLFLYSHKCFQRGTSAKVDGLLIATNQCNATYFDP